MASTIETKFVFRPGNLFKLVQFNTEPNTKHVYAGKAVEKSKQRWCVETHGSQSQGNMY